MKAIKALKQEIAALKRQQPKQPNQPKPPPPQPRLVRAMVEFFVPTVPFASYLFSRWGQITGTPENCRRLLSAEEAVLVFPEGARGISKPFNKRYQLADFGKGFMRLALETGAPIIPVAVIGAEEQAPAGQILCL